MALSLLKKIIHWRSPSLGTFLIWAQGHFHKLDLMLCGPAFRHEAATTAPSTGHQEHSLDSFWCRLRLSKGQRVFLTPFSRWHTLSPASPTPLRKPTKARVKGQQCPTVHCPLGVKAHLSSFSGRISMLGPDAWCLLSTEQSHSEDFPSTSQIRIAKSVSERCD